MKRLVKIFSVIMLVLTAAMLFAPTVFADSAQIGDTILISVSVQGGTELYSFRTFIDFDPEKIDYLSSDDCGVGTTVVNDQVEGQFAWASLFYNGDEKFTTETKIMEVTFIAKTDIDDVESEFKIDVRDAYDSNAEMVDMDNIKVSVAAAGVGFSNESDGESEIPGIVEESASAESITDKQESFDQATTPNGIILTYDEAEFDEVPPIKFEQQEKTDEHKTFKIVSAAAVAVCLVVALVAFIILKVKKD